jgi:hypothetical protein
VSGEKTPDVACVHDEGAVATNASNSSGSRTGGSVALVEAHPPTRLSPPCERSMPDGLWPPECSTAARTNAREPKARGGLSFALETYARAGPVRDTGSRTCRSSPMRRPQQHVIAEGQDAVVQSNDRVRRVLLGRSGRAQIDTARCAREQQVSRRRASREPWRRGSSSTCVRAYARACGTLRGGRAERHDIAVFDAVP